MRVILCLPLFLLGLLEVTAKRKVFQPRKWLCVLLLAALGHTLTGTIGVEAESHASEAQTSIALELSFPVDQR